MGYVDLRDQYISQVANSKSFADVGGLWGTINEKVSVAHQHGSTALTMIDMQPEGNELWEKFHQRMKELNINKYDCISGEICNFKKDEIKEAFDVVHCSGVLYHHPNPLEILMALRKITRSYLILTSAITQEVIENEQGRYELPPSGVLFVPGLNDAERSILKIYWENAGAVAYGLTEKVQFKFDDFAPWWWLPTATAMKAMCEVVGFKVLDSSLTWNNNAQTILLETV